MELKRYGYREAQAELRALNREIGKIAKTNADRHEWERKHPFLPYSVKQKRDFFRRIREQAKRG